MIQEYIRWFGWDPSPQARRARRIARLIFLVGLLIALFSIVPVEAVMRALASAVPGYAIAGVVFGFLATLLTSVEMWPLTRHQGIPHSPGKILAINLAVKFYSQFAPTTLVGTGLRLYRVSQPGGKVAEALAALAFFRVLETFLMLAIGIGFWLLGDQSAVDVSIGWVVVLLVTISLAWILVTRYSLSIYRWFTSKTASIWNRPFLSYFVRKFEKFLLAVQVYANLPAPSLLLAVSAGVTSAMAEILSALLLARSVGIQISFVDMGWIQAIVLFATALPIAAGGGLGIREVTLVTLLATFGVSAELSLALSFLIFARSILIGLCGGLMEAVDALRGKRQPVLDPAGSADIQEY